MVQMVADRNENLTACPVPSAAPAMVRLPLLLSDCRQELDAMTPLIVRLSFLEFPPVHMCGGGEESPQIVLAGIDPGAVSVAVMALNPFIKTCCSFSTWLVWNLPPVPVIPFGIPKEPVVSSPVAAAQGTNDFGKLGYCGPCPPPGEMQRYVFKVYTLDAMLDLPPGSNKQELIAAMRGHVLQYGETAAVAVG
jgi:Raf kinase inhibitor-like YbhB/YbcL family protein